MIRTVRTRFAPSPTGSIHFGNIRSALYTWAFARKMNGIFVLRIEDTDINRSSQEAVDAIIETMTWLGIDFDEGPFFQTDRIHRYQDVLNKMIKEDLAYPCYMSKEELEVLRDRQRAAGEKPRYDRTWRPEVGKILPKPPSGVKPLLRFKNPLTGVVSWNDAVKGQVIISNEELDDLVIARSDGTPTYNFCVVVDDLDMEITHVIRGDDHLSNTPRQINILRALGGKLPIYVHLPTLMNENGKKMSKRHSMISVMAYRSEGYLSEAIINYLARLGWSHGDSEIFSIKQFIKWFDFEHLSKSPARHNHKKLKWINSYYIKEGNNDYISILTKPFLRSIGIDDIALSNGPDIVSIVELMKKRTTTLKELAESAAIFYREPTPNADELSCYTNNVVRSAIRELATVLKTVDWNRNEISAAINKVVTSNKIKLAQLAMPVRLLIAGTVYTPSIDILLALFSRDVVISRLESGACE